MGITIPNIPSNTVLPNVSSGNKTTAIAVKEILNEEQLVVQFFRALDSLDIEYDKEKVRNLAEKMKSVSRWARYTDNENDIPTDGNVLSHSLSQFELNKTYGVNEVGYDNISEEDSRKLAIASLFHDVGEIKVGDKTFDHKQGNSGGNEQEHGIRLIHEAFSDSKNLEEILEAYSIDFDKSHPLHQRFKILEKLSYINGQINAFRTKGTQNEIKHLVWLLHNVYKNQIIPLLTIYFEGNMVSVNEFLNDNMETLDLIAQTIIDHKFIDPESPENDDKFLESVKIAKSYKSLFEIHRIVSFFREGSKVGEIKKYYKEILSTYLISLLNISNFETIKEYIFSIKNEIDGIFRIFNLGIELDDDYEPGILNPDKDLTEAYNAWKNFTQN